ncbi:MAG: glycoside hydrolase domain-containing protein [Pseudolysinimonas sp.]|uniref:glycoside hydrolase domain-containing protein n=1 Tax=Pseudolysinimonas sp. TaxID=2680009 RepID=UPI0032634A7E
MTVSSKRIQPDELGTMFAAGLRVFPIMQESNNALSLFTLSEGKRQGEIAIRRARQLGLASGTTIYFAVDFDATDDDITAAVLPFFDGVKQAVGYSMNPSYQVGVYGTRNVCSRVSAAGFAVSSYIAAMSTGWSGNLGFPKPANWAYDQIQTVTIGSGSGSIAIDRDAKTSSSPSLGSGNVARTPRIVSGGTNQYDESGWWKWAALAMLAERADSLNQWTTGDRNYAALSRIRKPAYWLMPGQNPAENPTGLAWTVVTADPPIGLAGSLLSSWISMTINFDNLYGTAEYLSPVDSRIGDTAHFAVSTLSLMTWGSPTTGDTSPGIGEYGSWGLDLATAWNDYEEARINAGGTWNYSVRTWMAAYIGAGSAHFGRRDLQADMAADICARVCNGPSALTLDEALRRIYVGVEDNPGYLATTFVADRFGSRATMVSAATALLSNGPPASWPVRLLMTANRKPGLVTDSAAPTPTVPDPPAGVLATEIDDFANGFADAVYAAMAWTTGD